MAALETPLAATRSAAAWRRLRLVAAFAAVYLLWGSTYLAVALAVRTIPPFLMMGLRSVVAGGVLLVVATLSGAVPRTPRAWGIAGLSGTLLFVGCHGLLAVAQRHVPSGL